MGTLVPWDVNLCKRRTGHQSISCWSIYHILGDVQPVRAAFLKQFAWILKQETCIIVGGRKNWSQAAKQLYKGEQQHHLYSLPFHHSFLSSNQLDHPIQQPFKNHTYTHHMEYLLYIHFFSMVRSCSLYVHLSPMRRAASQNTRSTPSPSERPPSVPWQLMRSAELAQPPM